MRAVSGSGNTFLCLCLCWDGNSSHRDRIGQFLFWNGKITFNFNFVGNYFAFITVLNMMYVVLR